MNSCTFYGIVSSEIRLNKKINSQGEEFKSIFFSLAIKGKDEYKFIPLVAYNRVAEIISEFVKKDDHLLVESEFRTFPTHIGAEVAKGFNFKINRVHLVNNKISDYKVLEEDEDLVLLSKSLDLNNEIHEEKEVLNEIPLEEIPF